MKTLTAILTAASVLTVGSQTVSAHDGWCTAGKVLTGVFVGSAIASAFAPPPTVVYSAPQPTYASPAPVYSQPAPVYVQSPPAYYSPAPVVVYSAPAYRPYPYYYYGGPAVSVRFGFGGGHYYYGGGHYHH